MYFILVGPFCFGLFVFHLAPGADFVCVCGPGLLVSGSRFCFGKIVWGIRSKTVRLRDSGFSINQVSVYTSGTVFALGACSLFGTNFCWFGSRSRFSFLWNEILGTLRYPGRGGKENGESLEGGRPHLRGKNKLRLSRLG